MLTREVKSVAIAALAAVAAIAMMALATPVFAAGQLIADGGLGGVLETKEHDVRVVVNNGIAVTEVEQVFVNKEDRIVEALYVFPVPKSASVANFSMWINGKEMIGEVVEKERAREIYNSYKQVKRDPGLLEQVNYKRFEMRIFPIPARGEQRVKVTYYQELEVDHDWATYVYPLATLADNQKVDERTTGRFSFSLEAKSEVPITAMESPSHGDDFVIAQHSDAYSQASLEVDGGDLSRDVVVSYRLQRPQSGIDLITSKEAGDDGYFMMTITAGQELEQQEKGMDYVFVLDVSGSMALDGKLGTSRRSIESFIEALGPEDRMEVMTFNLQPNLLFKELKSADEAAHAAAKEFLQSQQARGGTILRPALQTAYKYRDTDRQLNVVLLSDGITEAGEHRELLQLIADRPAGSRVFSIGVGNEVNKPLLEQIARESGGLAAFLSPGDDFQRQAQAFRRKLTRPAMSQLNLQFAGVDVYDVEPQELPDLYHGSPVRVFGRYRDGGKLQVSMNAEVLGKPVDESFDATLPEVDDANPEIERTWASHRVERLMNDERRSGSPGSLRNQIVELCEGYSIVSEYASFIVLENDAEYQRWSIERKNEARMARDGAALQSRREALQQLREEALAQLGPEGVAKRVDEVAQSTPNKSSQPLAANSPVTQNNAPAPRESRGFDFNTGNAPRNSGGGGGGATDPLTGGLLLVIGGWGAWTCRPRRPRVGFDPAA
ncbi:VIT and vWA domain-containing protein [Lacipirellula sp.]|uniref:VIT and vWA domain-containing protein n=1 Tax=Lacipirellula sp. TaxID=2691419 RepID=UPI003D1092BF